MTPWCLCRNDLFCFNPAKSMRRQGFVISGPLGVENSKRPTLKTPVAHMILRPQRIDHPAGSLPPSPFPKCSGWNSTIISTPGLEKNSGHYDLFHDSFIPRNEKNATGTTKVGPVRSPTKTRKSSSDAAPKSNTPYIYITAAPSNVEHHTLFQQSSISVVKQKRGRFNIGTEIDHARQNSTPRHSSPRRENLSARTHAVNSTLMFKKPPRRHSR